MTNLDKLWLRQLALDLEAAPRTGAETDDPEGSRNITMSDTLARKIITELRRIAGEPAGRAGHRASCPSLLLTNPGKCNCEAPYGAGGL